MENLHLLAAIMLQLRNVLRITHQVSDVQIDFMSHDNQYEERTFRVTVKAYPRDSGDVETFEAESTTDYTVALQMLINMRVEELRNRRRDA